MQGVEATGTSVSSLCIQTGIDWIFKIVFVLCRLKFICGLIEVNISYCSSQLGLGSFPQEKFWWQNVICEFAQKLCARENQVLYSNPHGIHITHKSINSVFAKDFSVFQVRKDSQFCFFLSVSQIRVIISIGTLVFIKTFPIVYFPKYALGTQLLYCLDLYHCRAKKILSQVFAVNLSQKYRLHIDRYPRRSVSGIERQWKCR